MTLEEKNSYLRRRDGVIEVLDSLKGHWDLAEWLSALIGSAYVTPELIDGIEKILREAIDTVKDETTKEKIQAGLDKIAQMKEHELMERTSEQFLLDQSIMNNFIV